jgi:ankyrin repeat protein
MRANVEDRGVKGDCTPLMEAASAGHLDIVKLLIAHAADVNAQSSSGSSSSDITSTCIKRKQRTIHEKDALGLFSTIYENDLEAVSVTS